MKNTRLADTKEEHVEGAYSGAMITSGCETTSPSSFCILQRNFLGATCNLRFYIRCWNAYDRWGLREDNNDKADGQSRDEDAEAELTNFYLIVTHDVVDEDVLRFPRESLLKYDCFVDENEETTEPWWSITAPQYEEILRTAFVADLQLVVPGVWIGSPATLEYDEAENLLRKSRIQHIVYCRTSTTPGMMDMLIQRGPNDIQTNNEEMSIHKYTVTLYELPRKEFVNQLRDHTIVPAYQELDHVSKFLNALMQRRRIQQEDSSILLYCNLGVSSSIAVCAALLMFRFAFPLNCVMNLIQAARRDVNPSKYLQYQLNLYDQELQRSRRCLPRLPFHEDT